MPRGGFDRNKSVTDPLTEKVIGYLRKKFPEATAAVGDAAETMLGPDNPPVNMALKLMDRADPMGIMGMGSPVAMVASHGSPAIWAAEAGRPLGQFRRSFKHTGEGSAYKGAGGYIAQEPKVTQTYRERAPIELSVGGKPVKNDFSAAAQYLGDSSMHLMSADDWVLARLRNRLDEGGSGGLHPKNVDTAVMIEQAKIIDQLEQMGRRNAAGELVFGTKNAGDDALMLYDRLDKLREMRAAGITAKRGGAYYTVDYPDELLPHTMSYEDALGSQPAKVQQSLNELPGDLMDIEHAKKWNGLSNYEWADLHPVEREGAIERFKSSPQFHQIKGENFMSRLQRSQADPVATMSGEQLYEKLGLILGDEQYASELLRKHGIPGHNFFDNFSRRRIMEGGPEAFTKNGDLLPDLTKNFVVYDPDNTLTTLGRHDTLQEMIDFQNGLASKLRGSK
jgi:hypothetical protein